jgi:DNA-binding transcriptional MocR family regulator
MPLPEGSGRIGAGGEMASVTGFDLAGLLSRKAQRAGPGWFGRPRTAEGRISLVGGFPDPESLPREEILESARLALERDGVWALEYGATRGYELLVEQLLAKLRRDQGIIAAPEHLLVTAGASQALGLLVDVLCDPGDVVLSEQPTWMGAVRIFRAAGVEVRPVPVGTEGIDLDVLAETLEGLAAEGRRPKFLYLIPTFQNPTGVTMPLAARRRLLDLASASDLLVIEDDAYVDLRYEGEPVPPVRALDERGQVAYLGTFSKTIAAGLRLGWMVAEPSLVAVAAGVKPEGGTSPFTGAVAAQFCATGALREHVAELREIYRERRDAMLRALAETMPDDAAWTRPAGGFFIWLTLPPGTSATRVAERARERGVDVLPGSVCFVQPSSDRALRLCYSFATVEQIAEGIARLAEAVREERAARA